MGSSKAQKKMGGKFTLKKHIFCLDNPDQFR